MFSNHKIQRALDEIKEISRMDLLLYDEKGRMVASTMDMIEDMEPYIVNFAESMAESQMLSGFHFFKVIVEDTLEYVLLIRNTSEESYMVGRLAVVQIRNIVMAYREQYDRNNLMQNILLGNMLIVDMYNKAEQLKISQTERVIFVIEVEGHKDNSVVETVKNLVDCRNKDFVTELDEHNIIVVKDTKDLANEEDEKNFAKMIVDTLHSEAMVKVRVGYGNRVEKLQDLPKSYQEACMALQVSGIFYASKDTISYKRLGIGRLIHQLPISLCEMFIQEVFGEKVPEIDEETLATVDRFFENDLNISETARQLYIHRNTLVYRLERFEKAVGLDVRKFDDAMTFKLAMMVLAHMESQGTVIKRGN